MNGWSSNLIFLMNLISCAMHQRNAVLLLLFQPAVLNHQIVAQTSPFSITFVRGTIFPVVSYYKVVALTISRKEITTKSIERRTVHKPEFVAVLAHVSFSKAHALDNVLVLSMSLYITSLQAGMRVYAIQNKQCELGEPQQYKVNAKRYIQDISMLTSGAIQYGVPFNERFGAAVLN